MSITVFKDNRSPSLTDVIQVDGVPFPLTTSTVKLRMRLRTSSTLKVDTAAVVTDAPNGAVRYDWAAVDTDTAGSYVAWWRVTLPGGLIQESPQFEVQIEDPLTPSRAMTVEELRDHVETDLTDEALQALLDDAVDEIIGRFGDDGNVTRVMYGAGPYLTLRRPAATVTSIVEANRQRTPLLTLVPGDYALMHGGRTIERLSGASGYVGYVGGWAPVVTVVYTPVSEQTLRNRVAIDLVKLAVRYAGVSSEHIGDYNVTYEPNYLRERERILQGMAFSRGMRF